jgi:hypothetical protein
VKATSSSKRRLTSIPVKIEKHPIPLLFHFCGRQISSHRLQRHYRSGVLQERIGLTGHTKLYEGHFRLLEALPESQFIIARVPYHQEQRPYAHVLVSLTNLVTSSLSLPTLSLARHLTPWQGKLFFVAHGNKLLKFYIRPRFSIQTSNLTPLPVE